MSKTNKFAKKLTLTTETLRRLTGDEIAGVFGGQGEPDGAAQDFSGSCIGCPSMNGACPSAQGRCDSAAGKCCPA